LLLLAVLAVLAVITVLLGQLRGDDPGSDSQPTDCAGCPRNELSSCIVERTVRRSFVFVFRVHHISPNVASLFVIQSRV
jgi:hypothetical protein